MQYIPRTIESHILGSLQEKKIIVLYGARQTGKTTLARHIAQSSGLDFLYYNCDEDTVRQGLRPENAQTLRGFLGTPPLLIIDEAQRIPNIGLKLKILHDDNPDIRIIATGSSSFELANRINEPLTGRMHIYTVTPMSYAEIKEPYQQLLRPETLDELLLYGAYPEVVGFSTHDQKKSYLISLTQSYLTKDIFELQEIQKSDELLQLLQLLAYQIGSEVNYQELSNRLNIHIQTIKRYIWLLEESYIIYRLPSFQKNHRNEIGKARKIFFRDLGVRNALINDFNALYLRNDRGALRENRLMNERRKYLMSQQMFHNMYFRRTYQQQELDCVETVDGHIYGYEYKRNPKKAKISQAFAKAYPEADQTVIHTQNYHTFIS